MKRPWIQRSFSVLMLIIVTLWFDAQAFARAPSGRDPLCIEQPLLEQCSVVRVEAIIITGMVRTRREVVIREILFEEGDYASLAQVEESIQRLRNLSIFRDVTYKLDSKKVPLPDGSLPADLSPGRPSRVLHIHVDERWTLLPFGSYLQGGGLTRATVGLNDVNVLGRYLEAGFQYSRIGESDSFWQLGGAANSFLIWFSNPRFLNQYTRAGVDLRRSVRLRRIYEDRSGEQEGGFTLQRDIGVLRLSHEVVRWFRLGANVEFVHDSFSSRYINEETTQLQLENFGSTPPSSRVYMLRWFASLGRVNRQDFYFDGGSVTGSVGHSDALWGASQTFSDLDLAARYYLRLPWRGNLAFRALLGLTNTDLIQYLNYIGGLDRVRGFPDSRFRGRGSWSLNAEYRVAPVANRWFVIQAVGFADAGATDDRTLSMAQLDGLSVGGGVRLIVPKVLGLTMRADYAVPLVGGGRGGLSLGAGQFF